MKVSVVGSSGYAGGELLRLLLHHPKVEVGQAISDRFSGKPLWKAHPNLRRVTDLVFSDPESLASCDALFLALPHGLAAAGLSRYAAKAPLLLDLSADFRLRSPDLYRRFYGDGRLEPELVSTFVYGLPELHRADLRTATRAAIAGCTASASILALAPLVRSGLCDGGPIVINATTGSSAAGSIPGASSHHSERSGTMRWFAPTGHRHTPEVEQELGLHGRVHLTVHSVEAVRGILSTAHVPTRDSIDRAALWRVYRQAYGAEPFIRIVDDPGGIHRYPDPKILTGSNFCDIGFAAEDSHVVVAAAIDNLMKGAAGNAVQCLNLMAGFDERAGLSFPGLHPV